MVVAEALPGEPYEVLVTLQNTYDHDVPLAISDEGAIASWVTTDPADRVNVPAGGRATLRVVVSVPADAAEGSHRAVLRLVADAGENPSGSGAAVRWAVGLPVNVTVGGEARRQLVFLDVRAPAVGADAAPVVYVRARNLGNVRADAAVDVALRDAAGATVATARGARAVGAGETREVEVVFPAPLAPGKYRAVATAPNWTKSTDLIVGAAAAQPASSSIEIPAQAALGSPLRIAAAFRAPSDRDVERARLTAEIYNDAGLAAVVESEPLAVPRGAQTTLTAYWQPAAAGTHTVVAFVFHDGHVTPDTTQVVEVEGARGIPAPGALALLAFVALLRRR